MEQGKRPQPNFPGLRSLEGGRMTARASERLQCDQQPNIQSPTIQEHGTVTGRNWQDELGLPTDDKEWEPMAQIRGLSSHHIRFVLMDESLPRFSGNPRLQPQTVTLPQTCPIELGHSGFVVGFVYAYLLGFGELRTELPSMFGFELPRGLEGDFVIGQARLFDSLLAEKAWQGLQQGTFTRICHAHICPLLSRPLVQAVGTWQLIEVSLTTDDSHGYPGARVLKTWKHNKT